MQCFDTFFVDFYINFTLRQWTGRVKRAHIIFSHDDWGDSPGRGQGIGHRGQLPPCHPLAPPMISECGESRPRSAACDPTPPCPFSLMPLPVTLSFKKFPGSIWEVAPLYSPEPTFWPGRSLRFEPNVRIFAQWGDAVGVLTCAASTADQPASHAPLARRSPPPTVFCRLQNL